MNHSRHVVDLRKNSLGQPSPPRARSVRSSIYVCHHPVVICPRIWASSWPSFRLIRISVSEFGYELDGAAGNFLAYRRVHAAEQTAGCLRGVGAVSEAWKGQDDRCWDRYRYKFNLWWKIRSTFLHSSTFHFIMRFFLIFRKNCPKIKHGKYRTF